MPIFRGVNNVAREIEKEWRGVGNVARNIEKEWRGVGNVARQVFQDGLTLYDYGKTNYALSTRPYSGNTTPRGVIASNSCYINTTSMLADTYGNSDIDSHLGCPSFVIIDVTELNATDITKYTTLEVTYEIGTALTSSVESTRIEFGGWAGHEWDYDTDLETKGDSYYWNIDFTHEKGVTGIFTQTVDITSTGLIYDFLQTGWYHNTEQYKTRAKNFYFGAWTHTKKSSDERIWYCGVPVTFYRIRLL